MILLDDSELRDIVTKVENNERLTREDGLRLMESKELLTIGYMADVVRKRMHGDNAYFVISTVDADKVDTQSQPYSDWLVGTGLEVLPDEKEINSEEWLEMHKNAHDLGHKTNAAMLYGHMKTSEQRIDCLIKLRDLQDRTGGFLAFIPLAFLPENSGSEDVKMLQTTGYEDLKVLAIARLMLDNFDHIKAYWEVLGSKLVQVSLSFGVDDIGATVVEEKTLPAAGGVRQTLTRQQMIKMIKAAGRIPAERDTLYKILKEGY